MAGNVQVILKQDVDKLGKVGDVVNVKPGFARNYLIPKGLVAAATGAKIQQLEHQKAAARARVAKQKQEATEIAEKLSQVRIEVSKPAGENGKLFGSVTAKEVASLLAKQGLRVDKRGIQLPDHLKQLGDFDVPVKLAPEVVGTFKLTVLKAG